MVYLWNFNFQCLVLCPVLRSLDFLSYPARDKPCDTYLANENDSLPYLEKTCKLAFQIGVGRRRKRGGLIQRSFCRIFLGIFQSCNDGVTSSFYEASQYVACTLGVYLDRFRIAVKFKILCKDLQIFCMPEGMKTFRFDTLDLKLLKITYSNVDFLQCSRRAWKWCSFIFQIVRYFLSRQIAWLTFTIASNLTLKSVHFEYEYIEWW